MQVGMGAAPMMVSPYAGPLHGLHTMTLPQHMAVLLVAPLSQRLLCDSLLLSEDGYTARRTPGYRQAVIMGSTPLERQPGGLYFEVRISGTSDDASGGLAIGITHTAPETLAGVPAKATDVDMTVA